MKSNYSFIRALLSWRTCLIAGFVIGAARVHAANEERFATTNDAVKAFVSAASSKDVNAMETIFGTELRDLISADAVQASNGLEHLALRVAQRVTPVAQSDSFVGLELGYDVWPFPIALKQQDGQWYFDTAGGREEILNRRIGRNELDTIRVCHAYVQAQREYDMECHDGSGVMEYAQHLRSSTGKHDGLYWHAEPGEETSPFGPLISESHGEGYRHTTKIMSDPQNPYHGYIFKVLTREGKHAPGGKYNYIINGHMVAGFALVAWPAEWSNSGVMTFIINQEGKVFERNLGPKTAALVGKMAEYDPAPEWKPVSE